MPSRILNTNMGLGFQRGRKYDTDLDRLGRMETSHGELRKTRELNLQAEMRKLKKTMRTFSVRRFSAYPHRVLMTEDQIKIFSEIAQREFGMGDVVGGVVNGARDITGNVVEGAGKVVGSGAGKFAAGALGAYQGVKAGALLGATGIVPWFLGGPVTGGIIGGIAGGLLGSKIAGGAGSALKNIGQDIHT